MPELSPTPEKRLSKQFHQAILVAGGLMILLMGVILVARYLEESAEQHLHIRELTQSRAAEIDSAMKRVIDRVDALAGLTVYGLEHRKELPRHPIYEKLGENAKIGRFSLEYGDPSFDLTKYGNLHGAGLISEMTADQKDILNASAGLMPYLGVALKTTPHLAYLYYQGTFPFGAIIPPIMEKDVFVIFGSMKAFSKAAYTEPYWSMAIPENNPSRQPVWSAVYMDITGRGLFVSYSLPLYVKNQFEGIIGADIMLNFLNDILRKPSYHAGQFYLVSSLSQVLGHMHPELDDSKDVSLLADVLPESLSQYFQKEGALADLKEVVTVDGYSLSSIQLQSAPWHLIHIVPKHDTMMRILRDVLADVVFLLVVMIVLVLGFWQFRRHYIQPAFALVGHIGKKSRDEPTLPPNQLVPHLWQDWFTQVSHAFDTSRENEQRFRGYFELGLIGMAIIRSDKSWIDFNDKLCRLLGYDHETLTRLRWSELIHPSDLDLDRRQIALIKSGEIDGYAQDKRFVKKDGTTLYASVSSRCVRLSDGSVDYFVTFIQDLTERKKAEQQIHKLNAELEGRVRQRTLQLEMTNQELKTAIERAENANQAKSIFLANMSHELRTPLNAVLGFSQLMSRDSSVTESQQRNLVVIQRSGYHLLDLINDVLDMSKIEAGRTVLEMENTDLFRLVEDIFDMMLVRASEGGLTGRLEYPPDLSRYIRTDPGKLRQILINLLSNAIKYTNSGEVGLIISDQVSGGSGDHALSMIFTVWDTGAGIAPEDLDRVFDPFVQAGRSASTTKGTGLGLAISRQFARLMGGDLTVSSVVEEGTRFTLTLPMDVVTSADIPAQDVPARIVTGLTDPSRQLRVLIVDDMPDNRLLLSRQLEIVGAQTREAKNGQEALEIFGRWHPDLIWLDMRMPVMDGYETVRRIRSLADGQDVVIVALTASAFKEDVGRITDAGCNAVLHKPYQEYEIFDLMAELLGLSYTYQTLDAEGDTLKVDAKTDQMTLIRGLIGISTRVRQTLYDAASRLDVEATLEALVPIRTQNADLAQILEAMAVNYQYDRLLEILEASEKDISS
ncbi:MAG: PAS domain S-box protein [Magnetococcales bacterium]|nr:PAS domain S-box protein [Magnetococcales bacterium]